MRKAIYGFIAAAALACVLAVPVKSNAATMEECIAQWSWVTFQPEYMSQMMFQIYYMYPELFQNADESGVLNDPYAFFIWYLGQVCVTEN